MQVGEQETDVRLPAAQGLGGPKKGSEPAVGGVGGELQRWSREGGRAVTKLRERENLFDCQMLPR